jgi:6-phosphogluconate dehydrogenase
VNKTLTILIFSRCRRYVRNEDYVFYEGNVARKTEGTNVAPRPHKDAITMQVPEDELCDIGVFGLSVVGTNLALNMAEHGFKVAVGNRSFDRVPKMVERAKAEGGFSIFGAESPMDLIAHLKKPRKLLILIQAGAPVDDAVSTFARYMEDGDVIMDGGDEWFPNSIRRAKFLEPKGIHFIGMGISGGEEEVRNGPSIMAGGSKAGYDLVEPILTKIAAQVERTGACAGYLGPIGAVSRVSLGLMHLEVFSTST